MTNWNPRDIAIIVRDALQTHYEAQTNQGAPASLIGELEQEATAGLRAIQALVDDMARQERIWLANDMTNQIGNPAAELGGTFSRARWLEIKATFDAFKTWMRTPLVVTPADEKAGTEEVAVLPIVVVSRRGNPAAPAPVAEPEPTSTPTDTAPA